jgi:transposase
VERRQICWAHLKRNRLGFAERSGPIGDWGQEAVAIIEKVFAAWYRFKVGGGDRAALPSEIAPLRHELQTLGESGGQLPSGMVRGFWADGGKLEPALWTFVSVEGVEPTNNAAERALRPAVLWRKSCFGADSSAGNGFVAKILTVAATGRQHNKRLLPARTEVNIATRNGPAASSRVPT